ncbi:MAG: D-2-hydroxyacid dehydrogenase [Gammaproteobacteria bacterium]|jgi:D-2-hydroxyacid dehydrogenase (NADP+)|nr:D-2-hydroxyacid dehydrogenase [Gammaproteobacteria bacterium]MBT4493692.1 D-2-hydroxyacid dehydrogenase [Gammaproteobacteria bacterium]MBT7371141.1 D-2-hydroxyacid dehydrogenase [Gammaproteobacteria bacterium]
MELHSCLWNDVSAFDFSAKDLSAFTDHFPDMTIRVHRDEASFLSSAKNARFVLTWDFPVDWYAHCPNLELIFTPAAGADWVEPDPDGRVHLVHGTFHGDVLAESLLHAILHMNHSIPAMIDNFRKREWDRNLQQDSRLLRSQTVLIIGLGNIGQRCAEMIGVTGARVIGVRKSPTKAEGDIETHGIDALPELLPQADHIVLLLPGEDDTDRFMSPERLSRCKRGAFIYNFGRGNALYSDDLIEYWDIFAGAFLDVTDEEPLSPDSPLWQLNNIVITPHSSCIYDDYRQLFVAETLEKLKDYLQE